MPRPIIEIGNRATRPAALKGTAPGIVSTLAVGGGHPGAVEPEVSDVTVAMLGPTVCSLGLAMPDSRRRDRSTHRAVRRAAASCPSGGRRSRRTSCPFLENVTRGRGIPRGAARGGRPALLHVRRAQPDQRPQPRVHRRGRGGLPGRRPRAAGLLGQPQLGPLPRRHAQDDAGRRRPAGAVPVHQRLLELLGVPAVPREPRRRGGRGGGGSAAARPGPALLQPPGVRGADGRRHAGGAGRAAGADPQRRAHPLRHPLDPGRDERRQRPRRLLPADRLRPAGRRLRRPAPERRGRDQRPGPAADRPPVRHRARLLLPVRVRRRCPGWSRTSATGSPSWPRTGCPAVVAVPIGFVSDHMEVVYDLDTEAKAVADEAGHRVQPGRHRGRRPALRRDGARPGARALRRRAGAGSAATTRSRARRSAAWSPPGTSARRGAARTCAGHRPALCGQD